jgi:uncharacterized linocin/CFP29 family protein
MAAEELAVIQNAQEYLALGGRLNINSMRPTIGVHQNALLRKNEWEEIDAAVVDVARTSLNGIADLVAYGLVRPLGGLGTIMSTYEQLGDMSAANISMEGVDGEKDRTTFTPQSIPVPLIHKEFTLSLRHLEASRRMGEGLDLTQVRTATRKVRDAAEGLLFNGTGKVQVGGYTIYGYTTHTKRITDTATNFGGGDFGTAGNGYKTIVGMINQLAAKGFFGPYGVYVSRVQYGQLLNQYGNLDRSELAVILLSIPNLAFVKASDVLADGNLVVVQLTSDVVDLALAQDITAVQWDEKGGMLSNFRVMGAMVPRVKFDANSACGVAHATGA